MQQRPLGEGGDDSRAQQPPVWTFNKHVLCWVDLELTGLNLDIDTIVEIAVILTDTRLRRRVVGPNLVIRTDPSRLNEWCQETFSKNGLLEELTTSQTTLAEAEEVVYSFITKHITTKDVGHLAGSSVHIDRLFLLKYMPRVTDYLNHRILDVSSIKICAWSWYPETMKLRETRAPKSIPVEEDIHDNSESENSPTEKILDKNLDDSSDKEKRASESNSLISSDSETNILAHRAMWDIQESISLLKFMRSQIFIIPGEKIYPRAEQFQHRNRRNTRKHRG